MEASSTGHEPDRADPAKGTVVHVGVVYRIIRDRKVPDDGEQRIRVVEEESGRRAGSFTLLRGDGSSWQAHADASLDAVATLWIAACEQAGIEP